MKIKLRQILILLLVAAVFFANQAGLLDGLIGETRAPAETVGTSQLSPQPETPPPETAAYVEFATEAATEAPVEIATEAPAEEAIREDGEYTSRDEVAAYIHEFGHLPANFIKKDDAEALGWVNKYGNLWKVAPGKSIGGDYFGNYEGLLPKKKGRKYYECDIDFDGKYRNAQRIIFSNDGLIYYTDDHYESFTLLYGGK